VTTEIADEIDEHQARIEPPAPVDAVKGVVVTPADDRLQRLILARIDLNEVSRDAIRLANLHRDASIAIDVTFWHEPLCVEGSAQRLVQAVLNVLMNSRQALGRRKDGHIALAVRADAEQAVIEVRDDGPGIPRELHERIFDPFFTTKDPDQGTGLGLAVALEIARDHGGVLDVRSPPGEGATFSLRLPAWGSGVAASEPSAA
jgi:signal transduction histidine kinase